MIILDTCNLCFHHGKNKVFSSLGAFFEIFFFKLRLKGVAVAIKYYQKLLHPVIAFMASDYYEKRNGMIDEDIQFLKLLIEKKILHLTPKNDYDDSYIIKVCWFLFKKNNE